MAIIVRGATCSLGEAVVDKLLSMDIDVVATEDSHRVRNETLLKYSQAKLLSQGEGYSISFDGSTADLVIGENLIVNDLIPTRNDRWMPEEFKTWSKGKEYIGKPRYWLSVIDAANAIAHLANTGSQYSGLNMCGRREWLCEDTQAEFKMLWDRTNQGQSGEFTAQTLFGHEIAGMEAKPIQAEASTRPDLQPLHNALLEITGDGWRSLIPLRTAIMTMIAGIIG